MKKVAISALKCVSFLLVWALLMAAVTMPAIFIGGENWPADLGWRFFVEAGGAVAILVALVFMALVVDKRGLGTIGFSPLVGAAPGLLGGTLGAAIFLLPVGILVALGAARFAPNWSAFSAEALGLGLALCVFNVITQEVLARGYIFQELWSKFGAWVAGVVTTLMFLSLHAPALAQGTQGLIAAVNIALASAMICVALVRTRTLWLPIGIHLGWNGLQGPVLGMNVTGAEIGVGGWRAFEVSGDALLTGGALGVEGGAIGLIGPLLGLLIALMWPRRVP